MGGGCFGSGVRFPVNLVKVAVNFIAILMF